MTEKKLGKGSIFQKIRAANSKSFFTIIKFHSHILAHFSEQLRSFQHAVLCIFFLVLLIYLVVIPLSVCQNKTFLFLPESGTICQELTQCFLKLRTLKKTQGEKIIIRNARMSHLLVKRSYK